MKKGFVTEYILSGKPFVLDEEVEGLLETFEIASDKKLLRNIKESLREAEKGQGRSVGEILTDPLVRRLPIELDRHGRK